MLKVKSSSGSIELSAEQERHVRGLDDEAICRALNRGVDVYVCAVLSERPLIRYTPNRGWHTRMPRRPSGFLPAQASARPH
jgi:hypothetical protein